MRRDRHGARARSSFAALRYRAAASSRSVQRAPPWIMPKADLRRARPSSSGSFKQSAVSRRSLRSALPYRMLESRALGLPVHPSLMKTAQKVAERHYAASARPQLRATLTPDYTMGCKRTPHF